MCPCRELQDALWEAAESGLIPAEVAGHLGECPECRAALDTLSSAASGFATLRHIQAPDPTEAVHAGITRSHPRRGIAAATVIALCCAAAVVLRPQPDDSTPAPTPNAAVVADSQSLQTAQTDESRGGGETALLQSPGAAIAAQPGRRPAEAPSQSVRQTVLDSPAPADTSAPPQDVELALDPRLLEPCPQQTIILAQRPRPSRPTYARLDPTYRTLDKPPPGPSADELLDLGDLY